MGFSQDRLISILRWLKDNGLDCSVEGRIFLVARIEALSELNLVNTSLGRLDDVHIDGEYIRYKITEDEYGHVDVSGIGDVASMVVFDNKQDDDDYYGMFSFHGENGENRELVSGDYLGAIKSLNFSRRKT